MFNCSFKSNIFECTKRMSSTVSLTSAVLFCEIVEPATLNDRSLAALEAGIESIALANLHKRVSEREFMRHQSRTLPLVSRGRGASPSRSLDYKCLHGFAPPYLAEDCVLVASLFGRHNLRSADTCTLFVLKTSTNYGSRSYAVHGPNLCNSLPAELRLTDT